MQGVVKALFEQKLLPRVLAGSSVGSIGALSSCNDVHLPCDLTSRSPSQSQFSTDTAETLACILAQLDFSPLDAASGSM